MKDRILISAKKNFKKNIPNQKDIADIKIYKKKMNI